MMNLATWRILVTLHFFCFMFFILNGEHNFCENATDIQ